MVSFSNIISKTKSVTYNVGLRNYMLGVYNYMTLALALSGVVAYLTAYSGLAIAMIKSPFGVI